MADFIVVEQEEEENLRNPMGISGCLVDDRRRVVSRGLGKVDDSGVISETLMTEIPPKLA